MSDIEGDKLDISHPQQHQSKMHGGEYDAPIANLGPDGGNSAEEGGWIHERGYGVPILASDEVARNPGGEYMHAAVEPEHERYNDDGRRSGQARSRSRPKSSGEPLTRLVSREAHDSPAVGTPLEEIQEYEPLFPDDDEEDQKPMTAADRLKRPNLARHHFPSQDIWEDNPGSLALTTTVSTPQLPEEENESRPSRGAQQDVASTFEHPDVEAQRKNGNIPSDRAHYMTQEGRDMTKSMFKPGVADEMSGRPGTRRFPSQDIWEDSPDSLRLETTVSHSQEDQPQAEEITSPQDKSKPQVPPRSGGSKQAPSIPERPKPSVAAKPRDVQTEATSPPEVKAKPAVPSRPEGGKFASIKASFMNDLNSRLKLGPQGPPKKEEPQEEAAAEKAPLEDARKGRAKGPARRKPATAAAAETASESSPNASFSLCAPRTVFSLDEDGTLNVPNGNVVAATGTEMRPDILQSEALPPTLSQSPAIEDKSARLTGLTTEAVGFDGDTPDPHISAATVERHAAIAPGLSEALQTADREVAALTPEPARQSATKDVPATTTESSTTAAPSSGKMVDESSQTGQHDITFTSPKGEKDQFTTYLGGKAPDHGNVIVKDGEEIIGDVHENTPRKIETTGHGM